MNTVWSFRSTRAYPQQRVVPVSLQFVSTAFNQRKQREEKPASGLSISLYLPKLCRFIIPPYLYPYLFICFTSMYLLLSETYIFIPISLKLGNVYFLHNIIISRTVTHIPYEKQMESQKVYIDSTQTFNRNVQLTFEEKFLLIPSNSYLSTPMLQNQRQISDVEFSLVAINGFVFLLHLMRCILFSVPSTIPTNRARIKFNTAGVS